MSDDSDLNLRQKYNCQNDVRISSLSRKRSSNWRPPVEMDKDLFANKFDHNNELYQFGSSQNTRNGPLGSTKQRKTQTYSSGSDIVIEDSNLNNDMEADYKKNHDKRCLRHRSRHKEKSDLTYRKLSSAHNKNNRNKDFDHNSQQETIIPSSPFQTSKIDLHATSSEEETSDMHLRCCKEHVNNAEGDFVFRKIPNLFFRRNQIQNWQNNFFKCWLNLGCCCYMTKTLLDNGGSGKLLWMRCKKTMSYFRGGGTTLMLLLIFSILISGPGEAYPVEGGMYLCSTFRNCPALLLSLIWHRKKFNQYKTLSVMKLLLKYTKYFIYVLVKSCGIEIF